MHVCMKRGHQTHLQGFLDHTAPVDGLGEVEDATAQLAYQRPTLCRAASLQQPRQPPPPKPSATNTTVNLSRSRPK